MENGKIVLITGGQRSGKSRFAESYVLANSKNPVYLATAEISDQEMVLIVEKHRKRRGDNWDTIESPLHFDADFTNKTVLLDCLTMFATNHFFACGEKSEIAYDSVKMELDRLFHHVGSTIVVVSNEIGLGGISANKMQRDFSDLQGELNQYVASVADEVYMIVSGIPLRLK